MCFCATKKKRLSWASQKLTNGENPFSCHLTAPWQGKEENLAVLALLCPTEGSA